MIQLILVTLITTAMVEHSNSSLRFANESIFCQYAVSSATNVAARIKTQPITSYMSEHKLHHAAGKKNTYYVARYVRLFDARSSRIAV